ncbi:MAG: DNA polymerase-3 subunit epsilon [Candidatus Azotimanducaceae bacterium]|jgi:DNA polymerase-3 subunit epsilon|tara:strand:- start:30890 stop:31618 length:729 start_codon:yes stop_codon:yes gene_type:complete
MRQIVLDTETTGLEVALGHKIIEIGAIEMIDRKFTGRHFHKYLNPEREIDDGAKEVHGITEAFLADKPKFADIWEDLERFLDGAELIIHNAVFDISFLDSEIRSLVRQGLAPQRKIEDFCGVIDSLAIARQKHPGQKLNLDALCRRYAVDNSQRQLHGALLDAEILADVYLLMTGGQTNLFGGGNNSNDDPAGQNDNQIDHSWEIPPLRQVMATVEDIASHEKMLDLLTERSEDVPVWRREH